MSSSTRTARTSKSSAIIGLYITEEHDTSYGYGGGYYHVRASAVWVGRTPWELAQIDAGKAGELEPCASDRIRNVGDSYDNRSNGLHLDNLYVTSQGSDKDDPRRLYGWEVEYKNVFSVNARQAEQMAKTLRTIEKRMDATNDKYGRAGSFGAYLLRVADAIGATRIVLPTSTHKSSYNDRTHRVLELRDGSYAVDQLVAKWAEADGRTPAAVAVNGE